jgi:FimV-like protein
MSEVRRQNELYSIVTSEASEEVLALMDRNVALDSRIAELELLIRTKDGENAALSRRLTSLSTRLDETDKEVSLLKLQIASLDLQLKTANEIKVVDEDTSLSAVPKLNAENSISPQSQSAQSETGLLAILILGVVVVSLLSFLWLRRRGNDHNSEPTHNRASSAGGRESDKRASLSPNIEPELQTPSGEISQEDEKPASETQFENQEVMYGIEDPDSELNSNDEASEDEIATKLELAYAYSKMGDMESVRKILGEVVGVANASQRVEAENLMKGLLEPDDGRDKEE